MYLNDIAGIHIEKTKNYLKFNINTLHYPINKLHYNMLISNNIKIMMPCNIVNYKGFSSFYYSLSNALPLAEHSKAESDHNIKHLISTGLLDLQKAGRQYFLDVNHILFDVENIYYSFDHNCLLFIYLPLNIESPSSIKSADLKSDTIHILMDEIKNKLICAFNIQQKNTDNNNTRHFKMESANARTESRNPENKSTHPESKSRNPGMESITLGMESIINGVKLKFVIFLIISQAIPIMIFLFFTLLYENYIGILFIIEMLWTLVCMIQFKKHKDHILKLEDTIIKQNDTEKTELLQTESLQLEPPQSESAPSTETPQIRPLIEAPSEATLKEIAFKEASLYKIEANPYPLYDAKNHEPYCLTEKINDLFFFKKIRDSPLIFINGFYVEKGIYYNIKDHYEISINGKNHLFLIDKN